MIVQLSQVVKTVDAHMYAIAELWFYTLVVADEEPIMIFEDFARRARLEAIRCSRLSPTAARAVELVSRRRDPMRFGISLHVTSPRRRRNAHL